MAGRREHDEHPERERESLAAWRALEDLPDLVARAAAVDPSDVAAVERLRRGHDPVVVRAALALAEGRRRLVGKFPNAMDLWADREGAEQASSARTAAWKARRFAEAVESGDSIDDRCAGIGGDAMAFAPIAPTRAIDRSPLRAWMAARNAGVEPVVGDAIATEPLATFVHLDPARRDESRGVRRFTLDGHEPPVDACLALLARAKGGALKLSPGIPLPLPGAGNAEIEFLSEDGRLVQAVVWTGRCAKAPGLRTASRVERGRTLSMPSASLTPAPCNDEFGRHLHVADPALERSGLADMQARSLGLWERAPGLGVFEAAHPIDDGWFDAYEVLARPKPRLDEVRAELRRLGGGRARVRTRGKSADADRWTKDLAIGSGEEFDVFLLRVGSRLEATIARPAASSPNSSP
jgi:hypothetical protein